MKTADPFTGVLRILHLEDSAADRVLVQRALHEGTWRCEFHTVTTGEDFESALRRREFDLIIADFTLPGYNGTAALKFAQHMAPAIPFLFVSGTIGEERAVESLKNGATDYVLKDRLERLVPAVERAMRELIERRRRREAEAKYRAIFENVSEGIYQMTPNGRLLIANPAMARLCGYPDAEALIDGIGESAACLYQPPGRRAELERFLRIHGSISGAESQIKRKDGTLIWVLENVRVVRDLDGAILYYEGSLTDITPRKRLEAQLQQAQKMEVIGQLAGGIAHDFNNTLTVINGYSRLLLDTAGMSAEMGDQVREINAAGMRAGNLTRQLLLFSRKHAVNKQIVDLNGHIGELAKMLGRLIGEHIRLDLNLAHELPALNADAGMMEQILMNLSVNARDAMARGGVLTIATAVVSLDETEVILHPGGRVGSFICLTVKDTGCGIPHDIMPRIFEPFYTTKDVGLGTGLGLATVFGIVREHAGWIEVESPPRAGTEFKIFLPPSLDRPAPIADGGDAFAGKGSETILLVEDETTVRDYVVTVLSHQGYHVLEARSGVAALEVWKWHSARISLLLTDMVMPDGMSGPELADKLQAQKPGLKVVLMSGYTKEMIGQFHLTQRQIHFLQKPFQPVTLIKIVRETLDELPVTIPNLTLP